MTPDDILFEVDTPIGFRVRTTRHYWNFLITEKHETLSDRESEVARALAEPSEVRRSQRDSNAFLFYGFERPGRWLCIVAKRLNGDGFIITAYPADAIKEGETVWRR